MFQLTEYKTEWRLQDPVLNQEVKLKQSQLWLMTPGQELYLNSGLPVLV